MTTRAGPGAALDTPPSGGADSRPASSQLRTAAPCSGSPFPEGTRAKSPPPTDGAFLQSVSEYALLFLLSFLQITWRTVYIKHFQRMVRRKPGGLDRYFFKYVYSQAIRRIVLSEWSCSLLQSPYRRPSIPMTPCRSLASDRSREDVLKASALKLRATGSQLPVCS